MATKTANKPKIKSDIKPPSLTSSWEKAWGALEPIRSTWDEKEQALMAQTNDSASGKITTTRVTDAALSTLAYERQARVTAQLPTGRFYGLSKQDDAKAKALNIVVNRYIIPHADDQFDMLIKLRLWGLYASVYGSMPMFYDYRVDREGGYIGPTCYLVDPRCFAPIEGTHNVQQVGCYISTIMHLTELEEILERKTTKYNKENIRKVIALLKSGGPKKPTKSGNQSKENTTIGQRYDLSNATDRIEVVTKYTKKKWITFAPDYANYDLGEDMIIREIDNPHKSGRIPVVMRHCFPLLNSIFGLGDFERGMKIQKAKDSIINLFLEGAKNRVYPPLKMIDNMLTPSTIRYQAGSKWKVKQQNAVEAMNFGQAPLGEFQATFAALEGMLQNQFGTSNATVNKEQGGPAMGLSPQALKMQASRENARDTWDRFMGEIATQELIEGMANLLCVKMEKPINMTIFKDDIAALGDDYKGVEAYDDKKAGKLSLNKADLAGKHMFRYQIDENSTMKKDEEEQFQALMATWQLTHQDPGLVDRLAMNHGTEYDEGEHLKKLYISAGISDWEKILKEVSPEKMQQLKQAATMASQQAGQDPNAAAQMLQAAAGQAQPQGDPAAAMAQEVAMAQAQQQPQQPQQPMPAEQPMPMPQPQPEMVGASAIGVPMPTQQPQGPVPQFPNFEDPAVAQVANMILGGAQ